MVLRLCSLILTVSFMVSAVAMAAPSSSARNSDEILNKLYAPEALSHRMIGHSTGARAIFFANLFLSKKSPYLSDPLGEGEHGLHSTKPLYRFDAFDCTTFVETVLALARSGSAEEFKSVINKVRYKDGVISYEARNHFTSVDWIPNNTQAGFVEDITGVIAGASTKWAQTWIDKAAWYKKKGEEFQSLGVGIEKELAQLPYIAKEDLLNSPGLIERIPSGTIFHLVRVNWNLTEAIGTPLDVSHMGFLIRENGVLYMVHASNGAARDGSDNYLGVKKEPLRSYIERVMMNKGTSMVGFNIVRIKNK